MTTSRRHRADRMQRAAERVLVAAGAALAFAAALAAQPALPAGTTSSETLAPGLVHLSLARGKAAEGARFRVVAGTFSSQHEADARLGELAAALADGPEKPAVWYSYGAYSVGVVPRSGTRAAADATLAALQHAGLASPLEVEQTGQTLANPDGPFRIEVLEADPARVRAEVAHADDAAFGVEPARRLAFRRGAAAAINGGFFVVDGDFRGDSAGLLVIDGRVWSEPDRHRGAIGLWDEDGRTHATVGRVTLGAVATVTPAAGGEPLPFPISGIDRPRGDGDTILYTPEFHRTTLTAPGGVEVVVAGGAVAWIARGLGSAAIPDQGFVLSFSAKAATSLPPIAKGDRANVATTLRSLLPDPDGAWSKVRFAASAGPVLLAGGERVLDPAAESISRVFCAARHPRTAAGVRADGTLLFVTVDGRQPEWSVGMTCDELADLLLELGATEAVNLDGGGSTTMAAGERTLNRPSDDEGERANGDALLLFPRGD